MCRMLEAYNICSLINDSIYITVSEHTLESVSSQKKHLGITIDNNLTWVWELKIDLALQNVGHKPLRS